MHYRDYSMNFSDTFYYWLDRNKVYKPIVTVKYFTTKMGLKYIGYLYFGFAAAYDQLDGVDKYIL